MKYCFAGGYKMLLISLAQIIYPASFIKESGIAGYKAISANSAYIFKTFFFQLPYLLIPVDIVDFCFPIKRIVVKMSSLILAEP